MASVIGISPRHVQRVIAAGERLDREEVQALKAAPRRLAMKDLAEIGRIGDASERASVVRQLAAGEAKNAAAARKTWFRQQHGAPAETADKVDAAHQALLTAFRRAPAAAQRRFVASERARLLRYLEDLDRELSE